MNRTKLFISIGAVFIAILLFAWLLFPRTVVSPPPPSDLKPPENNVATTSQTIATTSPSRAVHLVPLAQGDSITSWNYSGYLNDNGPLEAAALKKISELKGRLGRNTDYSTCISLAQEYDHLGDGKSAYEYLSRAIALDPNETTGVGWHNLGVLMEKLGAYNTARMAHDKAVEIQPGISSFQVSRLEFMITYFPKDTKGVEQAFADAEVALDKANAPLFLDLRQRWQQNLSQ